MARNFVADGEHFNYTASGAVASGDVVLMGAMIGVSLKTLAAGETGPARTVGVYTVPKLSTDVLALGAQVYWDNTNKRVTTTASGNTACGKAYTPAGSGAATAEIAINR